MNARNLIAPTLVAGLLGLASMSAQAQTLEITISDGVHSFTAIDGGMNDSDPGANSVIIDSPTLAALFPGELGLGGDVNASSNIGTSNTFRRLLASADLVGANGLSGAQGFTITASQNGFTVPATLSRSFSSTGNFSFNGIPAGTTSTFQSGVDPNDVLFAQPLKDTVFSGTSSGTALNSEGTPPSSAGFTFNNGGDPYTITSVFNTSVYAAGTSSFQSTARVDGVAVPEPGSVAMLIGMGISGSAFVLRRRRK
jgi:hypothetical protein